MDDKTQKERLDQELRFLKESFEAEVISKEEFEKGRDRIEKKLNELQPQEKTNADEENQEKIEAPPEPDETKKEEEPKEEKIKLKVIHDEADYFVGQKTGDDADKPQEDVFNQSMKTAEPKKKKKYLIYAVVFVVLMLAAYFSYSLLKQNKETKEKTAELKFAAVCSSDNDCRQEGKEGTCLNPGAKDSRCEFKEIPKTNVLIVNEREDCFNCDTKRVLGILESWFGTLNTKEVNYNLDDGKNLADKFEAKELPLYIFDENITQKPAFEEFKQAFVKNGSNYILREDAAGSTFYLRRDNIPNKLDLFVISGDDAGIKAEKNLKEFLDAFPEVKFEKHFSGDKLAQELGIRGFPTFLVNNRVRFSGVQAAETIKENFCMLNKLAGCEKSLSKSLV